jgi:hypothetical protein
MSRFTLWLAVSAGLLYLAYRMAVWHLLAQILLIVVLAAWVVGLGLVMLGQALRHARETQTRQINIADVRAADERTKYAAQFGEAAAKKIDNADPRFWRRVSTPREAGK